jgi:RNA polymerase sigma factor (TIGR02999 family)
VSTHAEPGVTARPIGKGGEPLDAAELLPALYSELRRLAAERLRHTPPGNTLQATALVHEAYLRLVDQGDPGWNGRGHFFGAAARAMRDILVEQARRKAAIKHGGAVERVPLDEIDLTLAAPVEDIVALDEALRRLESVDPGKSRIVMLRYFAGLSAAETAAVVGVSERTIEREWRFIKAWLRQRIVGTPGDDTGG